MKNGDKTAVWARKRGASGEEAEAKREPGQGKQKSNRALKPII